MNFLRAWVPAILPVFLLLLWILLGARFVAIEPMFWVALCFYALWIGWHRQEALRFRVWFQDKKTRIPPVSSGIWEETFAEGYHYRRSQERQQQILTDQIVQLRDALQALPDAVLLMDDEGRLLWVNPAAVRLLHLQWPEDLGKPLTLWMRLPQMQDFLMGRGAVSLDLVLPEQRSDAAFEALRYPLGEAGALVLIRDVTRIRQLEQIRRDFVANVSHELRSPLTVVRGFLENLLDNPLAKDPEIGPQLQRMESESLRMQSLLEDLLSLARMEASGPDPNRCEPLFPAPMIERVRESLADEIQAKSLRLHLDLDGDLGVRAEPLDIQSIIQNLFENAVKYTPPHREIQISWAREGDFLVLRVLDSGDGIPPEHLQRVTERFYRVDPGRSRRVGGTGLGLSIVRHAAERYGGTLRIHSEVGKGSEFSVFFPGSMGFRGSSARADPQDVVIKVS